MVKKKRQREARKKLGESSDQSFVLCRRTEEEEGKERMELTS